MVGHPLLTQRLIGLACLLRGIEAWRILDRVLDPATIHLPLIGIPRPPHAAAAVLAGLWLLAALAFTLDYRRRVSGVALAAVMAYVLLLDQQTYSNHLYLLCLLVAILSLAEGRVAQVLLRMQLSIVYGFAALTKLTPVYLSGVILAVNLPPWAPPAWQRVEVLAPLAVASVMAEAFLAIAFWSARWRPAAWVVGVGLHLACVVFLAPAVRFQLAIFSLVMIALYPVFGPVRRPAALARPAPALS